MKMYVIVFNSLDLIHPSANDKEGRESFACIGAVIPMRVTRKIVQMDVYISKRGI